MERPLRTHSRWRVAAKVNKNQWKVNGIQRKNVYDYPTEASLGLIIVEAHEQVEKWVGGRERTTPLSHWREKEIVSLLAGE